MSLGRWACGGWRTHVSRERPLTSRERRAYASRETAADFPRTAGLRDPRTAADFPRTAGWASRGRRRKNPANGRPGSAAGGGGAPPSFLGPSICHGRVAGRTRETRGKVNNEV